MPASLSSPAAVPAPRLAASGRVYIAPRRGAPSFFGVCQCFEFLKKSTAALTMYSEFLKSKAAALCS